MAKENGWLVPYIKSLMDAFFEIPVIIQLTCICNDKVALLWVAKISLALSSYHEF